MNFEPRIITKQSINSRKIHEVNDIDIGHEDEVEINEAHVRNPNYKGKNYNPNYAQNRLKTTNNTNNTSTHNTSNNPNNTTQSYGSSSQHSNSNSGYGYSKSNQQEKPVNVSVTLHGPVSKEQLYKIQEVLRHPSQYRDRIKPEDCPVKGEYATAFNKFHPKKVEVNEATVEEAIKYGQFLKKSEEDIAEAMTYIRHWAMRRSKVQKKIQWTSKNNHNNDYLPSMLQKNIFPPYTHLHPGNWTVSPLL